jgi:hypothetical protein
MNASAATAPDATAPGPQSGFGELRCRDCGNPAGALAGFGFCRGCGAPMCFYCASNNIIASEINHCIPIPLLIVPLHIKITRIVRPKVTFCRSCLGSIHYRKSRVIPESIAGSLLVAICIALPLIGGFGPEAIPGATIAAVLFGLVSFLPIYFTLKHLDEKISRPTCPVCGRDATGMLFKTLSEFGVETKTAPDMIDCGCGYKGLRAPLDGLWAFVDKNGPKPLAGSPVDRMAQASAYARQDLR